MSLLRTASVNLATSSSKSKMRAPRPRARVQN